MSVFIINTVCIMTVIYLVVMSISDIKNKQINLIPGVVLLALICLVFIIFGVEVLNLLPGVAVGVFLFVVSKVSRGGVGEADAFIYLITGITLGLYRNIEVLLISLLLSAIISAVLLLIKKVGRKYKIPFIPFTCAGYIVVIIAGSINK
ncbi:MAG: hypothetical protein K5639_04395 [Eubacterium sp.]|nr:hypothetical protein [Eubacterium sp.]